MPHIPVLLHETIRVLSPLPGETFIDGTFGSGGHAREIAKAISPGGTLLCIDRDPSLVRAGIQIADALARDTKTKVLLMNGNYADADLSMKDAGIKTASGMLVDAGFSSLHITEFL